MRWRDLVRQAYGVALPLLAAGDVLEDQQHAMGMVAGLRDFPGVQVEDTAAETRKIILDLETFDRLVLRKHLLHQMAERRHVPLVLAQLGNAPPMRLRRGDPEYLQERLARGHDRHVVFEHDQGIADRVDDALRELPVALALGPGGALLADILDGEQNGAIVVAGTKNLPGIDQHGAPADGREIMIDLEPFDRCPMRYHAFEQDAQRRDIPLPVSEVVDMTSLGLLGARAKRLVECTIGGCDVQISIENDECAGHGLDNVACSNIGDRHFHPSSSIPPASTSCGEQGFNRDLQLILRVGLAKAFRA
jgi:hypothetical protein